MPDYGSARWTDEVKARFWAKVDVRGTDECWNWKGCITPKGYAQFSIGNTHYAAHRLLYVKTIGELSPKVVCDHLCRNRQCVNPQHLEPVSNRENIVRGDAGTLLRARNREITHCPYGHEYTPENTRRDRKGSRNCRACQKRRHAELTVRRREQRARALASESQQ